MNLARNTETRTTVAENMQQLSAHKQVKKKKKNE